mgnify:FL=1
MGNKVIENTRGVAAWEIMIKKYINLGGRTDENYFIREIKTNRKRAAINKRVLRQKSVKRSSKNQIIKSLYNVGTIGFDNRWIAS